VVRNFEGVQLGLPSRRQGTMKVFN